MICESCKQEATVNITYGLYERFKEGRPHLEVNMCKGCSTALWNNIHVLVNLGEMHWVNKKI